jgi:hypothetical protein
MQAQVVTLAGVTGITVEQARQVQIMVPVPAVLPVQPVTVEVQGLVVLTAVIIGLAVVQVVVQQEMHAVAVAVAQVLHGQQV